MPAAVFPPAPAPTPPRRASECRKPEGSTLGGLQAICTRCALLASRAQAGPWHACGLFFCALLRTGRLVSPEHLDECWLHAAWDPHGVA